MAVRNSFDLQIQSIASDGKHSSSEIVEMAHAAEVTTIALTDHDTVAGVEEFLAKSKELGLRALPGIELSVEDHHAHILGYGIDPAHPELQKAIESLRESRTEGAKKIVENLKTNEGFNIEWDDVLREAAHSATITRPHIVSAVMAKPENAEKLRRDGVRDKNGFFETYLSDKGRNFVSRTHMSAEDGIRLIHAAGGVAVWSHPPIPDFTDGGYDNLEKFFLELLGWGIDGIEVFSASNREDDVEFLYGLAEKHEVLKTGGSDFHEAGTHPRSPWGLHSADRIGDFETYGFPTDDIVPRLLAAIGKPKV